MKIVLLVLTLCLTVLCATVYDGMELSKKQYAELIGLSDAPVWSLEGQTFLCKVQKAYDGDSIKCIIKYYDDFYKFDYRVNGLDTPQVASGVVRDFGKEVRDIVQGMILGKIVKVVSGEADKYGRILGDFYAMKDDNTEINFNQFLIDHAMAKAYDGGTKEQFTQDDYDYFINNYRDTVWPTIQNWPNQ